MRRPPDFTLPGYLRRWYLFRKRPKARWNVYLHHILAPDPGVYCHDHPAWNITIVLRGHYIEHVRARGRGAVWNRPGTIRFRRAATAHRIANVSEGGCWTIWIRGGHRRKWGFWVGSRWVPWDEYDNADCSQGAA